MLNQPLKPMLLYKSDDIPEGEGYLHQLKFDGHRALLHYDNEKVKIFTRHLNECTFQYPEMQEIQLHVNNAILDGEMVVLDDEQGKPCFESVMQRFQARKESSVLRLSKSLPAHFIVFDVLYVNHTSVMDQPLNQRLEMLNEMVTPSEMLSLSPTFDNGKSLFKATVDQGLEGIVSKRKDSKYHLNTRSHDWLKIKNYQYEVVEIGGIRKKEFAWSILKDGRYVGTCEFVPPNERKAFYEIAQQLVQKEDDHWIYLDPLIRCKVKFQCWTKTGMMRTPSFVEFVL